MLNRFELKKYRNLRGVSLRDVAKYGGISHMLVSYVESGERNLTEENYKAIIKGINDGYEAKKQKAYKQKAKEEKEKEKIARITEKIQAQDKSQKAKKLARIEKILDEEETE